jgi:hypothetical protein
MKNTKAAYLVKDRVLDRADEIERKMKALAFISEQI